MVKLPHLRYWRELHALTQRDLALMSGVSRPTIARIETGATNPYPGTVRKLAQALDVAPSYLMEDDRPIAPSGAAGGGVGEAPS